MTGNVCMAEILFFKTFLIASLKGLENTIINMPHSDVNEEANYLPFENCCIYLDVIDQLFNGKNEAEAGGGIFLSPKHSE